jgi:quercetin dioxygenase-like cupin family protein
MYFTYINLVMNDDKVFYKGNLLKDAEAEHEKHRGWVVGRFMSGARKTNHIEIKYWNLKKGGSFTHPRSKQKEAVHCVIVLKGRLRGEVDGEEVILDKYDYLVIPPKIYSNVILDIFEDVEGITIKAPSIEDDKIPPFNSILK